MRLECGVNMRFNSSARILYDCPHHVARTGFDLGTQMLESRVQLKTSIFRVTVRISGTDQGFWMKKERKKGKENQDGACTWQLRMEILSYLKKTKKNKPQAILALLLIFYFSKMAKVKPSSGIINPFHGDGDAVAWLKKVQLVARFWKIDDVASLLPLYLEEDTLQLYLEMDKDQKTNINLIESQLKKAFLDREFSAYAKLKLVRWAGECVDVYISKIW